MEHILLSPEHILTIGDVSHRYRLGEQRSTWVDDLYPIHHKVVAIGIGVDTSPSRPDALSIFCKLGIQTREI